MWGRGGSQLPPPPPAFPGSHCRFPPPQGCAVPAGCTPAVSAWRADLCVRPGSLVPVWPSLQRPSHFSLSFLGLAHLCLTLLRVQCPSTEPPPALLALPSLSGLHPDCCVRGAEPGCREAVTLHGLSAAHALAGCWSSPASTWSLSQLGPSSPLPGHCESPKPPRHRAVEATRPCSSHLLCWPAHSGSPSLSCTFSPVCPFTVPCPFPAIIALCFVNHWAVL